MILLNTIIVDDELPAIDVIKYHATTTPFINIIGTFTNPIEALQFVNSNKVDLVFIDIQMPELNGLDFVKAIGDTSKVILTTAYSEFAVDGFELEVLDYLVKPVSLPRFVKAAQRALNIVSNESGGKAETAFDDDFILIRTDQKGKLMKIMLNDIDYIEGMKNYVAIYHVGQKTMALLNMKDLEERLPDRYFMRIQKSYIVSLSRISMIEGNMVMLKNYSEKLAIGESYKQQLMQVMKDKLMER